MNLLCVLICLPASIKAYIYIFCNLQPAQLNPSYQNTNTMIQGLNLVKKLNPFMEPGRSSMH
jgi:hypothetical protein